MRQQIKLQQVMCVGEVDNRSTSLCGNLVLVVRRDAVFTPARWLNAALPAREGVSCTRQAPVWIVLSQGAGGQHVLHRDENRGRIQGSPLRPQHARTSHRPSTGGD